MNLGSLVEQIKRNKPILRSGGASHPLETAKGIFSTGQDLYGDDNYTYYVLLINQFDRAIINDNLHLISQEQQKLLREYFAEAHLPTERFMGIDFITTDEMIDYEYDWTGMIKHIEVLDDFLGSYYGEDNGPYSRYGTEQFHSQREYFGKKLEALNRA